MKKGIAVLLLILVAACGLVGCGNENWGPGNFTFKHVHFNDGVTGVCADVKSWHDNELGCEVHTQEYGALYLSEGTYILVEDPSACPFCSKSE